MSGLFLELNLEPAARFTRYRIRIDRALNRYTFVAVETCGYAAYVLLFTVVLRLYHPVLLRYDDGWYLLVSYSWLNGFGFTNHWGANPISSGIFNWHGFLQPLIISWLSPCRTLTCLNIGLSVVGVAYLALWFFIVRTLVSVPSYRWALYIIGVGAVLEFSARAELLASYIILLGTSVFVCLSDNRWTIQRGILIGVLLGLLIITHPAASILSATLIAATVAYLRREDVRVSSFLLEGFWCVVSAVCVMILLLHFLFPFHDPTLWLHGIYEQIIANSKRNDAGDFLKYFLMTKMFPTLIFPLMSLAFILAYSIKQRAIGKNRWIFAFFIIALASFAVGLYYSSFRIPATFYNFSVFVPALALLCFYCTISQCRNVIARWSTIPIVGFALACALAQSVWLAQKIYYASDYDRLASEINSLVARYSMENCRIAMDPPIATAVDDVNVLANTSFLFFGDPAKKNNNPPGVDVLLRAQTELSSLPAPNADFALVESKFYSGTATRFIKPESLYFALYKASSSRHCGPSKAN